MSNQLFIVCPFSCMEIFLRNKYGNDILFLTFSGAVFPHHDAEYLSAVKHFIVQEEIKTIYIVNDISCRFINGIINKHTLFGLRAEKVMEALYIENYLTEFQDQSLFNQQNKLAELNILKQANEIMAPAILGNFIAEFSVEIKCLVTSKARHSFKEIQIENSNRRIYEL